MPERNDEHIDEQSGYTDNRQINVENSPYSQQAMGNITNYGIQPRRIRTDAGDDLKNRLSLLPPESFQISWLNSAECAELGAVLQQLLEGGGWTATMQMSGATLSGIPPRGLIIETKVSREAVGTFIEWAEAVGLSPEVNKGERKFSVLEAMGSAPIHIIVGLHPSDQISE